MLFDDPLPTALDGERLDRIVSLLTGVSRAEAAALVAGGEVLVDGVPVLAGSRRVRTGQRLTITGAPAPAAGLRPDPDVVFTVVHADDDVIVVDKPAGLVVHPGAGHEHGTLVHGLLARFPEIATVGDPARPGIVHRLDRGTSGLLVVARTPAAYDALVAQLAARAVERVYTALVWGIPDAPRGVIDAPIGRSARDPERMTVTTRGRPARTRYEVVRSFQQPAELALLRCRLETGRTHQIRVHLAAVGHPVVGDARYQGVRDPLAQALDRPFLHATRLAFTHPRTGVELRLDSPLPADLVAVLDRCG